MCKIFTKLQSVCDHQDPGDQKILLLADLVDDRLNKLSEEIGTINRTLDSIKDSIVSLTTKITGYMEEHSSCPVAKNRSEAETLMFMTKSPKILILVLVGIGTILGLSMTPFTDKILKFTIAGH